jgi:hypothetical protein
MVIGYSWLIKVKNSYIILLFCRVGQWVRGQVGLSTLIILYNLVSPEL